MISRIRMWWQKRKARLIRQRMRIARRQAEIEKMRAEFWREHWQTFNMPEWSWTVTTWTENTTPDNVCGCVNDVCRCGQGGAPDEWPDEIDI